MTFSIRSIFCFLAIVAFGIYCLINPSKPLLQAVFSCTVVLFLFSIVVAKYGTEQRRCFAFGFSVFGLGYLFTSLIVGDFEPRSRHPDPPMSTSWVIEKLYFPLAQPKPPPAGLGGGGGIPGNYGQYDPPDHLFRRLGHIVFSWLFAAGGGALTQMVQRRGDQQQERGASPAT